jgi:hypothetical protein
MTQPGDGVASAGAVALDVEPDAEGFYPRLRAQVLPEADRVGREVGRRIASPIVSEIARGVGEGVRDGGRGMTAQGTRIGNDLGAAIGRALRARVAAAVRTLPQVRLDADTSALDRKLAAAQAKMVAIASPTIRIDVNDGPAMARLSAVQAAATAVGAARPTVAVDADTAAAEASLAAVQAAASALSSETVRIRVSVSTGTGAARLEAIAAAAAALDSQTIEITVRVDASGSLAELAAVATAVRALGQMTPVITPRVNIAGAMASLAALGAAANGAAGGSGMAALIAVGVSLAPLLVPAIAAVVAALAAVGPAAVAGAAGIGVLALGFSGVFGAIQKVRQAQDQARTSAVQLGQQQTQTAAAVRGVAAAHRALANAEANAAEQRRQSTLKIRDAERALTSAQQAARVAQEGLTAARRAAIEAAEDLEMSVRGGALAQRAALLDVTEAQMALDDVMTNPQATNLERQRAQLNYDQAVQNLEDLKVRNGRLASEQADQARKGVEGSDQVRAARERIADADTRATQAAEALAEARRDADTQARQSAFALAQANDGLIAAQEALATAHTRAGAAGVNAAQTAADAFRGHTTEFREFVEFILGIGSAFRVVRDAAERGLLPGVQAGITALLPVLPEVARFVGILATGMGELFQRAGEALASPFWVDFFRMLGDFAGPAMETFGTVFGGFSEGFASLLIAFMPFSQQFGEGLAGMATAFAEWAAGLSSSDGFAEFIDYVSVNGPLLLDFLGNLLLTVIQLGVVFAPLGELMLRGLGVLFEFLANADPTVLAVIAGAIGAIILVVAGAATPIALIVAGVVLVAGALVYAWNRFEIFRTVVMAVVNAVATAAVWLWDTVLRPTFDFIVAAVAVLGAWWSRLYDTYIGPAVELISSVVSFLWNNIMQPVFGAIVYAIQTFIGPWFLALYRSFVRPAFTAIQIVIGVVWAAVQVIFGLIQIGLKVLGGVFRWLYENAVAPYFRAIYNNVIKPVWENLLKPVFTALGDIIEKYVAPGFARGVTAIETAWNKVRDVAKIPIRFVIETLLNNGLLAGYNKIASMFGVKPDNVQIPLPKGFATGGYVAGMGNGTSDSIMARLSNGEYVIPAAVVREFGVGFFDFLIGKAPKAGNAVKPGDGSEGLAFARGGLVDALPAFAEGGFVGRISSLWNTVSDPLSWVKEQVAGLVGQIPGAGALVDVLKGFGSKAVGWAVDWLREHLTGRSGGNGQYFGPISAETADVQNFIRRQDGKPYIWAGVGPSGYDCSGAVGAIYSMLHGRNPHSRVFSTANMAPFFPKAGHGLLTAGWAHPGQRGASPGVGHTAGNLAGLGFESRGGDGFVVGNRASSVDSFAHVGTFDSGGWLLPGLTVAYNGTGERERILTGSQWSNVERALAGSSSGGGRSVTYNVTPKYATVSGTEMRAIVDETQLRERHGRPE